MATVFNHDLCEYRKECFLLDGQKVLFRPICSDDKKALLEFHTHLSKETVFLRYQYSKVELTEEDLKNFCDIDYNDSLALVVESGAGENKKIIGVGRYYRLNRSDTAEVAFVVRDCDQRKGIGTQLLKQLAVLAWQRNIRYFVAEVLRENGKMLSIFRKCDPGLERVEDDGSTCTITLSIAEVMTNSRL